MSDLCGCIRCVDARIVTLPPDTPFHKRFRGPAMDGWRYACEQCGNKRCPHHTDHTLACTNSNEPGQAGSIYA
jgi:hypothetical protein